MVAFNKNYLNNDNEIARDLRLAVNNMIYLESSRNELCLVKIYPTSVSFM
jgi:hypothetical protein